MPKIPHTNITSLVQRWIGKYYESLNENKKIRATHETHLQEVENLNELYLKDLAKHEMLEMFEPQESYKDLFKQQIDFLTGVYTQQEKLDEKKRLRDKLKSIPNRHYNPQL